MAVQVQLDQEFGEWLLQQAQRLQITPNTLLRHQFGFTNPHHAAAHHTALPAAGMTSLRRGRAPAGSLLAQHEYQKPILRALDKLGGQAPLQHILDLVEKELDDHRLTPLDRQHLRSGELRWRSRAQHARLHLAKQGLIDRTAPKGIWRITTAGRIHLSHHTHPTD